MEKPIKIVLIEDEEFDKIRVQKTLNTIPNKFEIKYFFSDGKTALQKISEVHNELDVVIMDFQIAGGLMGEALIKKIKEINHTIQIIVISKMTLNITDYNFANNLLYAGAFWYCTKYPNDIEDYIYQPTDFILSVINAYEKKKLEIDKLSSTQKLQISVDRILEEKKILGNSIKTKKLISEINLYASSNTNVLIEGPSGSGKELVAFSLHYKSDRKFENFIAINCSSLPMDLIESELFGYEKGSFTGADKTKKGLFEQANNGTIFLDEIGELPLQAQAKLLRVLEEGEIEKIGRTGKIKVDVRVIAATNRNLKNEVDKRNFRADLYYRLNIIPIIVPSLSERVEDIPELFKYFVNKYSVIHGSKAPEFSLKAMQALKSYTWEGNVRELRSVAQRIILSKVDKIELNDILRSIGSSDIKLNDFFSGKKSIYDKENILKLKDFKKIVYTEYINFVKLNSTSDADAAKKLGLAQSNYHRLCVDLGLK